MTSATSTAVTFADLQLPEKLLNALSELGYEQPTPIQIGTIPPLLQGLDVFGQAQTGTGKTAAFALPLLARIELERAVPQVLVMAPTRELALQVNESFERYSAKMPGLRCLTIYGGQSYDRQVGPLKRGVHVVVGTPGRIIDLMERGALKLDTLQAVVLDEADEMLKMGFVEDIERILAAAPRNRQMALFSATLPEAVREIASKHLTDPEEITIEAPTRTATTVRQRWLEASGLDQKVQAVARLLETEVVDGVIIFVRTKNTTTEVADKLEAMGWSCAALSGDVAQRQREHVVDRLKRGLIKIVVATDVAARGLDVDRLSHVINFDIPRQTDAYIHRIGRTGRAGRSGEAILFVAWREKHMLKAIERATGQRVERMDVPTVAAVNASRLRAFKEKVLELVASPKIATMEPIVAEMLQDPNIEPARLAAAIALYAHNEKPLILDAPAFEQRERRPRRDDDDSDGRPPRRNDRDRPRRKPKALEEGMNRYRIEVGHKHGLRPGQIVGAIANEAGLAGEFIGPIHIEENWSTVDLPEGMPKKIFQHLKKVRVAGQSLNLSLDTNPVSAEGGEEDARPRRERSESRPRREGDGAESRPKRSKGDFERKSRREKSDSDSRPRRDKGRPSLKISGDRRQEKARKAKSEKTPQD